MSENALLGVPERGFLSQAVDRPSEHGVVDDGMS